MSKFISFAGNTASPQAGEAVISGIQYNSTVDGEGVRTVLFFSGCRHKCPGCQNPQTHDFFSGNIFDSSLQDDVIEAIATSSVIRGITLSGGDPMYSAGAILPFVKRFRAELPRKDVWVYSGFLFEEIVKDPSMERLLCLCDVLVDGPFIMAEMDEDALFCGSRNQRIIDVPASLAARQAVQKNFDRR